MIAPTSRKIGKDEIVRKLGRGGMADVYLAQDTENGGTVALKLIEHSTDADTMAAIEARSEEHTSELQSLRHLVCRLLLEKKSCILRHCAVIVLKHGVQGSEGHTSSL